MKNLVGLLQKNAQLAKENKLFRQLLARLVLDGFQGRAIVWPAGLSELKGEGITVLYQLGKDALQPQERLEHMERPLSEVDGAIVLTTVKQVAAPEDAPSEKRILEGT